MACCRRNTTTASILKLSDHYELQLVMLQTFRLELVETCQAEWQNQIIEHCNVVLRPAVRPAFAVCFSKFYGSPLRMDVSTGLGCARSTVYQNDSGI